MDQERGAQGPIDWNRFRFWQVIDPAIDWTSILNEEQIRQIGVLQINQQLKAMQMQMEYLQQVQKIISR